MTLVFYIALTFWLLSAFLFFVVSALPTQRPNIVLFIFDDLSSEFTGVNTALLAKDSVVFSNAFTAYPVCSPSRSAFLTGLYGQITGALTFVEKVYNYTTIPLYLGQYLGYRTASFGKVFHNPYVNGVDIYKSHWTESNSEGSAMAYDPSADNECAGGFIYCVIQESKSADRVISNAAISFLGKISKTLDPFFMAVGFRRPHLNNAITAQSVPSSTPGLENQTILTSLTNLNYFECPDLRSKYMTFSGSREPIVSSAFGRPTTLSFATKFPNQVKSIRQYYEGAVMHADYEMGRVINELKSLQLYDSTIIIMISDHGFNCGRNGMWCKNSLFDGATRVPFMIKAPEFEPGTLFRSMVNLVDLFPTLLSLIPVKGPDIYLSGKSLVGLRESERYMSFSQYPRCLPLGSLQDDACMFETVRICQTLKPILYMGYSVRSLIGSNMFTYVEWKPFLNVRSGCGLIFPGTTTLFPLFDKSKSMTMWNAPSIDTILLRDGDIVSNTSIQAYLATQIQNEFTKKTTIV